MEKYIECPKCEDIFGNKEEHIKVSRILKCGDSICSECLEELLKETNEAYFLCPECSNKIKKKKKVDSYTINKGMINTINSYFNIDLKENKKNEKNIIRYSIVSLGNFAVGKTSIFQRLSKDIFSTNYLSTIGFDLTTYNLKYKNQEYRLTFRDTAGQEKYRSVTKSILRLVDGALFIFDITNRDSFTDLEYWYNFYKKEKKDVVGLIIGNKCECESERKVDFDEAKAFAEQHQLHYLETSAKLDKNLKKAIVIVLKNIIESKKNNDTIESSTTVSSIDYCPSYKLDKKKVKKRKYAC